MLIRKICLVIAICGAGAVHYPSYAAFKMTDDEKTTNIQGKNEHSSEQDASGDVDADKSKEKVLLEEALKTILDPQSTITNNELAPSVTVIIKGILDNESSDAVMEKMDKLSADVCNKYQEALWASITDTTSFEKNKALTYVSDEEAEVKEAYWTMLRSRHLYENTTIDTQLQRKMRIIQEKGINAIMSGSKEYELISSMQRIWNTALVCAYNTSCGPREVRGFSDIMSIFQTSDNSQELLYYWKQFRDATGKKIRPIFKQYVSRMNSVARSYDFSDAGDLLRFSFDDDRPLQLQIRKLWDEVKPLYNLLKEYVRDKLNVVYKEEMNNATEGHQTLPAHLLGNLWAQEWQSIYPLVAPYPKHDLLSGVRISSRSLFKDVDEFHQSLGLQSSEEAYGDVDDFQKTEPACVPSSYDMCDGVTYRIKWCGNIGNSVKAMSLASKLLSQIQYFKHYKDLPLHFRDAPTPAFKAAIPNIVATQMTSPEQLKRFRLLPAELTPELYLNHLTWVALEKLPLIGYAFVLDSWRWEVFADDETSAGLEDAWNKMYWELRVNETGISAPVSRNESDLDPASKYHVVSHTQYITYLISEILEFQILLGLCKATNHTGPLHQCSLHGSHAAGTLLSKGMDLGASKNWKDVLLAITGETELSTQGIIEYFKPLEEFLVNGQKLKTKKTHSIASIIVGVVLLILTLLIVTVYCVKKKGLVPQISGALGMSQTGSLDITANEMRGDNVNEVNSGISEAKM